MLDRWAAETWSDPCISEVSHMPGCYVIGVVPSKGGSHERGGYWGWVWLAFPSVLPGPPCDCPCTTLWAHQMPSAMNLLILDCEPQIRLQQLCLSAISAKRTESWLTHPTSLFFGLLLFKRLFKNHFRKVWVSGGGEYMWLSLKPEFLTFDCVAPATQPQQRLSQWLVSFKLGHLTPPHRSPSPYTCPLLPQGLYPICA